MLLAAGADPNVGDNFSNVYNVAKEMKLSSLLGIVTCNYNHCCANINLPFSYYHCCSNIKLS